MYAHQMLALEQQLWIELISCLRLTRSLRTAQRGDAATTADASPDEAPVPLPQALGQLLPPAPPEG